MIDWESVFARANALYKHDGHPLRPYAYVSSGEISEGYFRGRAIQESPQLLSQAASALAERIQEFCQDTYAVDRIIGASTSGIALASHVALALGARTAFADRTDSGFSFSGFDICPGERVIAVDDTITSGGTLHALYRALPSAIHVIPAVAVLCNRSGSQYHGTYPVLSLLEWPVCRWKEGSNPFTSDGKERVPPVRPKEDWHAFTRPYG